jgi:hypothetical protein
MVIPGEQVRSPTFDVSNVQGRPQGLSTLTGGRRRRAVIEGM